MNDNFIDQKHKYTIMLSSKHKQTPPIGIENHLEKNQKQSKNQNRPLTKKTEMKAQKDSIQTKLRMLKQK